MVRALNLYWSFSLAIIPIHGENHYTTGIAIPEHIILAY